MLKYAICIVLSWLIQSNVLGAEYFPPDCTLESLENRFPPHIAHRILSQRTEDSAVFFNSSDEHSDDEKAYAFYCLAQHEYAQDGNLTLFFYNESLRHAESFWAYWGVAQLTLWADECHTALDAFSAASDLNKKYMPNFYGEYGAAEAQCGDPNSAISHVQRERDNSPFEEDDEWLRIEGSAYLRLGKYDQALEKFNEAIGWMFNQYGHSLELCSIDAPCIDPALTALYEHKIETLCAAGRMPEAQREIKSAKALATFSVPVACEVTEE